MSYDYFEYKEARQLMDQIEQQMEEHLVVKMENDFDEKLLETDYKKRAKATKTFNRSVQEVRPFFEVINPMQCRMRQIRTNLSFLLECAHNKISYKATAKYFAEYDFLAKEIKKEAKKCKNEAMKGYLEDSKVLESDFFRIMLDTLNIMKMNVQERMKRHPEQYINLDVEADSELLVDEIKETFKSTVKKLKEDKEQQEKEMKMANSRMAPKAA